MVTALDEAVGDVVAALKAAKMYEHTLVAWFSDK
jgi:arylsulfatase A-like enzyme